MKPVNVFSGFDGLSAGKLAFSRAGIAVGNYYRSEIDTFANKVAISHFPDDIQLGDITRWRDWDIDWSSIDYVIGGSPCQGFSFAGQQLAFDDPRSRLFFVWHEILYHVWTLNPNVKYLLENVKMKKEHLDIISHYMGVSPILINSALLSAQNRNRYYWCNWTVDQPQDAGILIYDILEDLTSTDSLLSSEAVARFVPCERTPLGQIGSTAHEGTIGSRDRVYAADGKAPTLTATSYKQPPQYAVRATVQANAEHTINGKSPTLTAAMGTGGGNVPLYASADIVVKHKGRYLNATDRLLFKKFTPLECERLQTFPDNYTAMLSNTQRYKSLGNSWTVDVIAHILRASV